MELTFSLPPSVILATGPHGLPRLEVETPQATAHVYFHGAHVAHYQPKGGAPLLFVSEKSFYRKEKPIRGGVPVIFPWFGGWQGEGEAPAHGVARLRTWAAESAQEDAQGRVTLVFRLDADAESRRFVPGEWVLRHRVTIGAELTMELEVENRGDAPFPFEEALHTYFRVSDIRQVAVSGLEGVEYRSLLETPNVRQSPESIRFDRETDRVYRDTTGPYAIEDPGFGRRIRIEKEGSDSAVVWNPWVAKAKALEDFGDDEWPGMLCVETGNIGANRRTLEPGGRHVSRTVIRVEPL